jgi:hypothetical protein
MKSANTKQHEGMRQNGKVKAPNIQERKKSLKSTEKIKQSTSRTKF